MPTLSIVSASGGAGRSTLTSALTSLCVRSNLWSLAVEFDPQNLLAYHFGAHAAPSDGLASRAARSLPWNTAALSASDGALVLPFGELSHPAYVDWERRLIVEPDWLHSRLQSIARPADGWTFIDTPRWPSTLTRQGLAASDLVLVALRPDATSLITLDPLLERLEDQAAVFVLNGFDSGRRLQADIFQALRERLGDRLYDEPIHRDEAIPEAFAKRLFVEDHLPHARVVHDLHGLLRWLLRQYRSLKAIPSSANVG